MRILCGTWLVPAASLIWIGLAATEVRQASEASQTMALGRTQATAILLALFTVLIGACVFIRQLDDQRLANGSTATLGQPPTFDATGGRPAAARWAASHVLAAVVALAAALAGSIATSPGVAAILMPVAAGLGFWASLVFPRFLVRHVGGWSSPLVVLAAGVGFQLTVGWLHLANPTAQLAPALIAEGLVLAWVAASAARMDPFAAIPVTIPATGAVGQRTVTGDGSMATEPAPAALAASVAADQTGFAPRPATPSIPEAMVGR